MAATVRYGIIGCNGIGETHGTSVNEAEGAELVACADLVAEIAEEFGAEYGCDPYTDPTEMIQDADLDAVSVCTPSGTHADVAIEAMEAGANVLCEKPLDVYAERIDRMLDTADREGVTLAGVFQRRTGPSAQRAREAVADGELGEMAMGDVQVKWHRTPEYYDSADWRGTREMDGGVLMNQAVHGIDLLQWLMGGVERVNAVTQSKARDVEVETVAAVLVEFENGAVGTIEASTVTYPQHPVIVELNGQEGSIVLEDDDVTEFETTEGEVDVEGEDREWGAGHAAVVQDFVDALREGREPMVPGREARAAVDVILAAYESAEEGGWVEVGE
jgi:predicted dehydrogenase